jgi:AraC-like DNA-binding protein
MNLPLDILVRAAGATIGLVFLLTVALSEGWRRRADLLLLIACSVAYLVCSAPSRPCCSTPWSLPLLLGAAAFPFAFWRLARVTLEDETSVPAWAWGGVVLLLLSAVVAAPDYLDPPQALRTAGAIANKVVALGFVAGALFAAWRSWDGDLIEPRRRLRWWLMAYLGGYGLVVMTGEVYLGGQRPPAWLDLVNAAAIGMTLLVTLLYFIQPRATAMDALFAPASDAPKTAAPARNDEPLLARLRELMDRDKLFLDPDLSVQALAARVGVPEYALRRLINERLGHRNFAAYVNEHRLREVERRLRDPQFARRPILTLALEAGFGSIGPFNRAFRERYGQTPTEFRTGLETGALR